MQKYRCTTIFFLLFLCVLSIWAASPLDGDWVGGFERPKSEVYVHAHFETATNGTTGTIDVLDPLCKGKLPQIDQQFALGPGYVPNTWLIGKPLDNLEFTPPHVRFELSDKDSPMSFDGEVTNGVMTGVVKDRGMKLAFRLELPARIDPSRYTGNYRIGPQHFITLFPNPPGLLSFDTQSGQMCLLLPRSDTDFVWLSGLKMDRVDAAIHFTTNRLGEITALQWKPKNAPAMIGTRIKALRKEDVSFTNRDVILSGTLVLPPTKGRHPAVVMLGGSGSTVRDNSMVADFFALTGVAALIYDKRGCGRSTGDLSTFTYDDLAGDALAGLGLLKNRPDINPRQIGLWGMSQGGYVVPLAASHCADVAFIISMAGPGVTPEAQTAYCAEHWMKAEGYSKADVNEARSLYLLNSRYRRTGNDRNELEAARKAAQSKPWYHANPILDEPAVHTRSLLTWIYDPVPALHKVHCPVLSIYGELDPLVPAKESADIWKAALREAGNHDVVIKIIPHAVHALQDTRTGLQVPGVWSLQRDWLLKHVTVEN
jgi:pimeloyl-ACP methyl ester carboxylesterase